MHLFFSMYLIIVICKIYHPVFSFSAMKNTVIHPANPAILSRYGSDAGIKFLFLLQIFCTLKLINFSKKLIKTF